MVDYIAFDGNSCFSIYEALEMNKTNLTCSCGKRVITKKESIQYTRRFNKDDEVIEVICQNIPHFSHKKNEKCELNELVKKFKEVNVPIKDNKPDIITLGSSITNNGYNFLRNLILTYIQSIINYKIIIYNIRQAIKQANNYEINYNEFLNPIISKLLNYKFKFLSFKHINTVEYIADEDDNIYYINDLNYTDPMSVDDVRFIDYFIKKTIKDDELFKKTVKSLSIITIFSSRCFHQKNTLDSSNKFTSYIENDVNSIRTSRKLDPLILPKLSKFISIRMPNKKSLDL